MVNLPKAEARNPLATLLFNARAPTVGGTTSLG